MRTASSDQPKHIVIITAALSVGAGVIHLAVTSEHFEESALFGVFFLVSAAGQLGWAAWVLRRPRPRRAYAVAIAGNILIAAVWLISRTVGLPVGPEPWTAERIQAIDAVATAQEVLVALGSAIALRSDRPGRLRLHDISSGTAVLVLLVFGSTAAVVLTDH